MKQTLITGLFGLMCGLTGIFFYVSFFFCVSFLQEEPSITPTKNITQKTVILFDEIEKCQKWGGDFEFTFPEPPKIDGLRVYYRNTNDPTDATGGKCVKYESKTESYDI